MKTTDSIRNEKGFILVLALIVMAAMTAIGLAIITSSTTDMLISRNETEAKKAFYLAEAGVQEALGRMRLANTGRFIGENSAQRAGRIANGDMPGGGGMAPQTFTSSDLSSQSPNPLQSLNGSYSVTVKYAAADGSTWCYGPASPFNTCDGRVILYGQNYSFPANSPPKGIVPVYQIDSTGTTASLTSAAIREYVTSVSLNVIPPAGDVYSNSDIGVGGSATITTTDPLACACGQNSANCSAPCTSAPTTYANMNNYLGLPTADLKQYADYAYTGGGTYSNTWGTPCSPATGSNVAPHICDNPGALVYIDNLGSTTATLHVQGRGILIITGNAKINASNDVEWEGMIYIMGSLDGNGTANVYGTMMANNAVNFNGTINIYGSQDVATSVAMDISLPKELRWAKR